MELLPFHDQGIADFAPDDQKDDFRVLFLHIIQDAQVANAEFKFRQGIWAEPLDCLGWNGRLIPES
jgi:hypothetical protein